MSQGTVLDFKAGTSKYAIQYTSGTTATLTKTQLMKILLPVVTEGSAPEVAAQEAAPARERDQTLATTPAIRVTTNEAVARSGTVPNLSPSQFVELETNIELEQEFSPSQILTGLAPLGKSTWEISI